MMSRQRRATAQPARRRSVLAALVAVMVPSTARAGGLEVGDNGAEAMGRGGAFVAKADNPAALNYNPAGFAKLRGYQATISANAVNSGTEFQRSGRATTAADGLGGAYPLVSNQKPWFVIPMHFVLTSDFGLKNLTFAAGIYGPSAAVGGFSRTLNVGGSEVAAPQRFDSVENSGLIMFPSVGLGWRVHPRIDIGVTFQWALTSIKSTTIATVGSACPQTPEDPACDVTINLDAQNWFAPSGSAGVLVRPVDGLELGGMVRLPSSAALKGKAKVDFGPGVKQLQDAMPVKMLDTTEPTVSLNNDYPLMFRLGARYAWSDASGEEFADVELDFTYEKWSSASKRTVQIDAISLGKPLKPVEMDWKLQDTYGVRLGGAYRFELARRVYLTARAGAFYESQSTDISDTSLAVVGARKIGLTAGLGLKWSWGAIDLAYAHVFVPERIVERSTHTASDFGGETTGPVVGNGTYRNRIDALYLQLTATYGASGPAPRRWREEREELAKHERRHQREREQRARARERKLEEQREEQRGPQPGDSLGGFDEREVASAQPAQTPRARTAKRTPRAAGGMVFEPETVKLGGTTFEPEVVRLAGKAKAKLGRKAGHGRKAMAKRFAKSSRGKSSSKALAGGARCFKRDRLGRCLKPATARRPGPAPSYGPRVLGMR